MSAEAMWIVGMVWFGLAGVTDDKLSFYCLWLGGVAMTAVSLFL